jgi:hypothetical protein
MESSRILRSLSLNNKLSFLISRHAARLKKVAARASSPLSTFPAFLQTGNEEFSRR